MRKGVSYFCVMPILAEVWQVVLKHYKDDACLIELAVVVLKDN